MVEDAQTKAADGARDSPDVLPLIEGPQDYIPVDAALPSGVNFGPAERGTDGQAEPRHLPEEGRGRIRLHSEDVSDDLQCEHEGAVRVLPVSGGGLHPHVPHAGRRRLGMGGHHGRQGHQPHRRRAAHRDRGRQGRQEPEAARDRAGPLHRDSRAARQRAVPVADDGPLQRAHGRGSGRQLLQRQAAGHHEGRREAVRRHGDDQERHRQLHPAADTDRHRRHGREAGDLGGQRRAQEPVLRPRLGEAPEQGSRRRRAPT